MKKSLISFLCIMLSLMLLTSCRSSENPEPERTDRLGIELLVSSRTIHFDSHDNFFGEGELYEVYKLERYMGVHIAEEISGNENWHTFPMDDFISSLIYGADNITSSFPTDKSGKTYDIIIPQLKHGYYCFYDKRVRSYELQNFASSYNEFDYGFCLAVFDIDNYTFYYLEMDR